MTKKTWLALGALVLAVAVLAGIYLLTRPQAQQGSKTVTVEIVDMNGASKVYTCHTDEAYLDKVLIAEGLLKADDLNDGMFTVLDGKTASWENNQAYWAVYINGEYATVGICDTPVTDGAVYQFVYEISNW